MWVGHFVLKESLSHFVRRLLFVWKAYPTWYSKLYVTLGTQSSMSHLVLKALCHTWYYVTLGTQSSMSYLETSTKSSLIPLSTKSMESLVLKTQCMERKLLYLYEKPSSENSMYGEPNTESFCICMESLVLKAQCMESLVLKASGKPWY